MSLTLRAVAVLLVPTLGCASTLYLTVAGASSRPGGDVFDCARSQLPGLGFTEDSRDLRRQRVTAHRYDWERRLSDTRFRRMVDRLVVEVAETAAAGSHLRVEAHSFAQLATQRGPTEFEQSASPVVRGAAQALRDACAAEATGIPQTPQP